MAASSPSAMRRTRSNSMVWPGWASSRSTASSVPSSTRYCLPPLSMTAYMGSLAFVADHGARRDGTVSDPRARTAMVPPDRRSRQRARRWEARPPTCSTPPCAEGLLRSARGIGDRRPRPPTVTAGCRRHRRSHPAARRALHGPRRARPLHPRRAARLHPRSRRRLADATRPAPRAWPSSSSTALVIVVLVEGVTLLFGPLVRQVIDFVDDLPALLESIEAQLSELVLMFDQLQLPRILHDFIAAFIASLAAGGGGASTSARWRRSTTVSRRPCATCWRWPSCPSGPSTCSRTATGC